MIKTSEFKQKIKEKNIRIAVVGLGYVGLPLAYEFAKKNCPVIGIDVDKDRLRSLKKGKSYITDISDCGIKEITQKGRFKVTGAFKILKDIDVVFICVPTPLKDEFNPDISFVISAVESVAKNLKKGSLVVLESTTYPGTTQEVILPIFEKNGLSLPDGIFLCFSPERIDPGNKNFPLAKIPKIIGGINHISAELAGLVYKIVFEKVHCVSSARVAETVKLLENTFRLVNIGLVDEMAMMSHKMGIDIWEVINAASTKPFGFMPFYPSAGVGGHCIPKDPLYLYWKAKHFGFNSQFIKLSSEITNSMPSYIIQRLEEILAKNNKSLRESRVLILGVTYKKDVKDLRKSPAIDIMEILQERSVKFFYYDPLIPYLKFSKIYLKRMNLNKNNLKRIDCVIVITDHTGVDYNIILQSVPLVFDTRNVYRKITDPKIIKL